MVSVYIRSPRYAEVIFERIYTLAAFKGLIQRCPYFRGVRVPLVVYVFSLSFIPHKGVLWAAYNNVLTGMFVSSVVALLFKELKHCLFKLYF